MIQAVLPFRLIPIVQSYFNDKKIYNLGFPSPLSSKEDNAKKVENAAKIIGFLDARALENGNSLGTKVELTENEKKILCIYFVDVMSNSFKIFWPLPFKEKLPTWKDYISTKENKHTLELSKGVEKNG